MMKRGKRLAALLMAALVGVSAAGCAKKDPETIYKEAMEKANEANGLDAAVNMTMTMKQGEDSLNMDAVMDMKMSGLKEGDFKYSTEGSFEVMDNPISMKQYYADGYQYIDMMGMKIKQAVELDEIMEQARSLSNSGNMGLEYIENLTAEEKDDQTVLTYTVNAEKMKDLTQEYMNSMMGAFGSAGEEMEALFEGLDFSLNSADGTMTVNKEGYPTAYHMNMDMDLSMEGETVNMVIGMDYQLNNPGQEVEVTIPDTSDYTEIQDMVSDSQALNGESH